MTLLSYVFLGFSAGATAAAARWWKRGVALYRRSPLSGRPGGVGHAETGEWLGSTIRHRLAEEKAQLENLDAERAHRGDSGFGKTTEDRIVWGELLELELQDIDEQIRRTCHEAGAKTGYRPRA